MPKNNFQNIVRAKKLPAATAKQLGVEKIEGENRLEIRAEADMTHLYLSGSVGSSWYDEGGITEKEVRDALKTTPKGKAIHVHINSEGGSVQEGLGIYNAFKERSADITAHVDGYALSIASVFPLAAGKVVSPKSAIWMIHNAWSWASGNADDMRAQATMLDQHDAMLAEIYAEHTGKPEEEIRAAMKAETWIRGSQAVEYGLADETDTEPDADDTQASYPKLPQAWLDRCQNLSPEILNALRVPQPTLAASTPAAPVAPTPAAPQGAATPNTPPATPAGQPQTTDNTMNKDKIVALLTQHGIEAKADWSDAQFESALAQLAKTNNSAKLEAIEARLALADKRRITDKVNSYVDAQKITKDEAEIYVEAALKDEAKTFALLDKKVASTPGGEPLRATGIEVIDGVDFGDLKGDKSEELVNLHRQHKTPAARLQAKRENWKQIFDAACRRDKSLGREVMASNTYSATLVTSFLIDGSVTDLQNMWSPLRAFSIDFTTDPFKPLATGVLKHVTAGATTQTNATNFESGDSTVAPTSVTMNQYSQSFQVSNSDLNSGLRMENLVKINTANFANKVIEVATAPITTAIFTQTPLTSAAAAFGFSDLAQLQGQLKKSPIKNLILDGAYIARIANQPGFFQPAGVVGGDTGAWKAYGWDLIAQNTDWTGAGANVVGFACNPQAIAGITGLPLTPPNIPGGIFQTTTAVIPGLECSIMLSTWFNPATRTMWNGMDIIAGFKEVDTTAGIVIKSA